MRRVATLSRRGSGHIWRGPGQTCHERALPGASPELLAEDRPVTRTWLFYGRLPKRGESYLCLAPSFQSFARSPLPCL